MYPFTATCTLPLTVVNGVFMENVVGRVLRIDAFGSVDGTILGRKVSSENFEEFTTQLLRMPKIHIEMFVLRIPRDAAASCA